MTQRFTAKMKLTEMVNRNGWLIYRDSQNGMYAMNEEMGIDIPLMRWNITLKDPKLNKIIISIRKDIEEAERKGYWM